MAVTPTRWWLDRRVTNAALVVLGVALLLPYLLAGPGHFLDDWFALRNARLDAWWNAAGDAQWRARPGAGVVYAITFGAIGARPWIHALLASVVLIVIALLLQRVLRRFVSHPVAFGVSAAWLVVPNHTSLETWPSALNISVALLFLVGATERLTVGRPTIGTDAVSAALLGMSVLSYEATAPAGLAAVLATVFLERGNPRRRRRLLLLHGAVLAAVTGWMVANWHSGKSGLDLWMEPVQVVNGHVSVGVVGENAAAVLLGAMVLVVTLVAFYQRSRHPDPATAQWPVQLMIGGWTVILLGALPFVRYFYSPVGFGDRVTVVSGLGGAAVLVGVVGWVGVRNTALGGAVAAAVLIGAVGNRVSLVRDYAVAADDSRQILASIEARWPRPPEDPVVFGPYPVMKRNIVAFIDADWPLQWLYDTRQIEAGFTLSEDAFLSFPPSQRVDVVELSNLEAVDRVTG